MDVVETIPLREHLEAMRAADALFHQERDRRYSEVAIEREKALEIKNEADKAALALARESQTLKDENAEKMRSQIESDRAASPERFKNDFEKLSTAIEQVAKNSAESLNQVADRFEAQLKPVYAFINKFEGMENGGDKNASRSGLQANWFGVIIAACLGVAGIIITLTLKG